MFLVSAEGEAKAVRSNHTTIIATVHNVAQILTT